jgi:hypothetical protein
MWDRRVVEKIEECMERYAVLVLCEIQMIILFRRWGGGGYMSQMMTGSGGFCGMS